MPIIDTRLSPRDVLAHVIDKKPNNYFDDEIDIYFDGVLPGGDVTKDYVDQVANKTLTNANNYTDAEIAKISGGSEVKSAVVLKDLEFESTASTVTLEQTLVNILTATESWDTLPLPVASSTQSGVINTATYKTIAENNELISAILNGAVAVNDIPKDVTQEQLTTLWKDATGETTLINRASIFDISNKIIWCYYGNVAQWLPSSSEGGTVTINQATNTSLGTVKGSTEEGQAFVETDGTLSINGWDALKDMVTTDNKKLNNLPEQVVYDTISPKQNSDSVELNLTVKDLHTGGDASLPITLNAATETVAGVMTAQQVNDLNGKQDALVSGTNIKTINNETLLGSGNISIDTSEPDTLTAEEFNNIWENK